jgi:hypothetical protein
VLTGSLIEDMVREAAEGEEVSVNSSSGGMIR